MAVYLSLFHGRKTVTETLDDWGSEGPILGPFNYVHTTYGEEVKVGNDAKGRDGVLSHHNGLLYYDGMYYGDWSVFCPETLTPEMQARIQQFDADKTKLPDLADTDEFVCQKCGKYDDIDNSIKFGEKLYCQECGTALKPDADVLAGLHLDDVSYVAVLDPNTQITTEEAIAAHLFESIRNEDESDVSEDTASQLGRDILKMVLRVFRPDLISQEQDQSEELEFDDAS
jgi:hypothetical protein